MDPIQFRQASNTRPLNVPPSVNGSVVGGAPKRVPMDDIELLQNPRLSRPPSEGAGSRPSSAGSNPPPISQPVAQPRQPIVRENYGGSETGVPVNSFFSRGGNGSVVSGSEDDDDSGYDESLPDSAPDSPRVGGFSNQGFQMPQPQPQPQPSGSSTAPPPGGNGGFFSKLFGWKQPGATGGAPAGSSTGMGGMGGGMGGDDESDTLSVRDGMPSMENQMARKQEMLYRLDRLEKMGYSPARKFNLNSSYEEIKYEYERLKKQRDADNAIKFSRKMLMAFVSGTEFMNDRFDPFGLQLSGWSEAVMEDLPSYDEVFEELHEKYKTKVQMAPELQLMWMVGSSAFMFHLSNSMFGNAMKGRNMGSIGGMTGPDMRNMAQNMMRDQMARTMAEEEMAEREAIRRGQQQQQSGPRREMRGPSGVDDLLGNLRNGRMPTPNFRGGTPPPGGDEDDGVVSGDEEVREISGERIFNRPTMRVPLR